MTYLLDTQALIWAQDDPAKLGKAVIPTLQNPNSDVLLSMATSWEIGIKIAIGKLKLSLPYRAWIAKAVKDLQLTVLPIRLDDIERQIILPFHHRDPFDRMIAAQALVEGISVVSSDAIFDTYGVRRLWN